MRSQFLRTVCAAAAASDRFVKAIQSSDWQVEQGASGGADSKRQAAPSRPVERKVVPWPRLSDLVVLAGLLGALVLLWGRSRHTWFWMDEALSLGISSHSLGEMRDVLAQDTSPPLYHLLLHVWMRWFGDSEASTHALSMLFSLAVVPAALWAGLSLFGRRTGWTCAVLAAVSPFLAEYANEARMYSLVVLLSLLATATFLHAFVYRRRRYLLPFAILTALALYTHYWALLLALGTGIAALVIVVHGSDRRRLALDAALAFGAIAMMFAPWVPTLLYQRTHSAVAWALPPTAAVIRDDFLEVLGGPVAAAVLMLAGGIPLVGVLRRPWNRLSLLTMTLVVPIVVVLTVGWATSVASFQWHSRYFAALLAPLLLLLGSGLARAGDTAVPALLVVAILAGPVPEAVRLHEKSNVKGWVEQASLALQPGDVVFAPMREVPLLARYLPDGLRFVTTTGPVPDPLAADWRNVVARLRRTDPVAAVAPFVDGLPLGGHIVVACPPTDGSDLDHLPAYIRLEILKCLAVREHLLNRQPGLAVEMSLRYPDDPSSPVVAHLLTKL